MSDESNAHAGGVRAVHASDLSNPRADQIVLWGVNDDGSCRCPNGSACPPKNRGKHPKCAPWEPGDNLGNLTGEKYGRIYVDVDVRGGADGFGQLMSLPGFVEPNTRTVVTATGGAHLEFKHPGFRVGNGKLAPHVDVRGDAVTEDGWAYVVAPGSRIVLDDGRIGEHTLVNDVEPSECPDWLLSALLARGNKQRSGFAPDTIDASHPDYENRVALGVRLCKEMPESHGDGEGGKRLLSLCLQLIRSLELPLDTARELVLEHFNPRCTTADGRPWPWEPKDIEHKLLDARDKSDASCGPKNLRFEVTSDVRAEIAALRETRHERARERLEAGRVANDAPHVYDIEYGKCASSGATEKIGRDAVVNILSGLADAKWIDVLRYDVLRGGVSAHRPPIALDAETSTFSAEDAERVAYWLATQRSKNVSPATILEVAPSVARMRPYNPLLEYFRSLPPSEGAIDELCRLLGAVDALSRTYVRKFLLAAVRRAVRPGCKSDSVLVLKGDPGTYKSSTVQALFGEKWTSESLPDLGNVKAVGEALASKWAAELAELAELFRSSRDTTTAFITRLTDRYRPAYARGAATDHPRMCVLVATVNGSEIYSDVHGADIRRLWILDVPKGIDTARIREIRDRVWSEAYAATVGDVWTGSMLASGEPHWLTDEEKAEHEARAAEYREQDPWASPIAEYIAGREEVTVPDVLGALRIDAKDRTKREANRAARVLRSLGCVKAKGVMRDGCKLDIWRTPDELRTAKRKHPIVTRLK